MADFVARILCGVVSGVLIYGIVKWGWSMQIAQAADGREAVRRGGAFVKHLRPVTEKLFTNIS